MVNIFAVPPGIYFTFALAVFYLSEEARRLRLANSSLPVRYKAKQAGHPYKNTNSAPGSVCWASQKVALRLDVTKCLQLRTRHFALQNIDTAKTSIKIRV
jgi:hypothetical protein